MTEYETPGIMGEKHSFKDSLRDLPGYIDQKLPTMDKGLDTYFDQHMPAIIDEWGLITSVHLIELERRLARVHREIDSLEKGHSAIKKRVERLTTEIRNLEGS